MTDFWSYLKSHAARITGMILGVILPLLWWKIGFVKTLLLALGMGVGYVIGRMFDDRVWFRRLMEKIQPRRED